MEFYMDKESRYRELVGRRRECAACPGLANASRIDGGALDSDRIGPYSQWQGNLEAELMVVAQDFADVEGFRRHRGWPGARVRTNVALTRMVARTGYAIKLPQYGVSDDQLFFTNAVLCMKGGGMRGPISDRCVRECGTQFLRPLVELVMPRVVVSLGTRAAASVCGAFDLEAPASLGGCAATPIVLNRATVLMPLYHPAASRLAKSQIEDWDRVAEILEEERSKAPVPFVRSVPLSTGR